MLRVRRYAVIGACAGALAVMMGAFGAHALRGHLGPISMQVWHTAVEYQFWHALALLAVVALARESTARYWRHSARCFAFGIPAFSGSLYALALGAPHAIGVITPIGGLLLIAGWIFLAMASWIDMRAN